MKASPKFLSLVIIGSLASFAACPRSAGEISHGLSGVTPFPSICMGIEGELERGGDALAAPGEDAPAFKKTEWAAWKAYADASSAFYKNHVDDADWVERRPLRLQEIRLDSNRVGASSRKLDEVDALLNDAYGRIRERLDPDEQEALRDVQQKWVAYRDADAAWAAADTGRAEGVENPLRGAENCRTAALTRSTLTRALDLLALQCVFRPADEVAGKPASGPRHVYQIRFTSEDYSVEQAIADVGTALVRNNPAIRKEFDSLINAAWEVGGGRFAYGDATLIRLTGGFERGGRDDSWSSSGKGVYLWVHPLNAGYKGGYDQHQNVIFRFETKVEVEEVFKGLDFEPVATDLTIEFGGFVDLEIRPAEPKPHR